MGGNWQIRWNQRTGTPATLFGYKTEPVGVPYRPEKIARDFLKKNHKIFKMKPGLEDLTFRRSRESAGITHLDFRQTYKGIPVYMGEYSVHVGSDGRIWMANGNYYPDISVDTSPKLSSGEAEAIAFAKVGVTGELRANVQSELMVYPEEDRFYLAWRVIIPAYEPFGDWQVFVNAHTGEVLACQDILMRYVNGLGTVYPTDPGTSDVETVTIHRLKEPGYTLDGQYCKVVNFLEKWHDECGWSSAYEPDHTFLYDPDDWHFDEVNVYYHIDRFQHEYWRALGFDSLSWQIVAYAHWAPDSRYCTLDGYDNAFFSVHEGVAPEEKRWILGFGDGESRFRDFAKEDDAIYHEYTHAVCYDIGLRLKEETAEATAMHEGYADYFPCSYLNTPIHDDWLLNDRMRNTYGYTHLRHLDTLDTYFVYSNYNNVEYQCQGPPDDHLNPPGDEHSNGMIWSGTLWDLRQALGQQIADKLIFQGLLFVHGYPTFAMGRDGIMAADIYLYDGAHLSVIDQVFDAREIYGPEPVEMIVVPEDYSSIQAAINAASPGQMVFVRPGVYNESVTMKTGVDVYGASPDSTHINSYACGVKFSNVSDCILSGFSIKGWDAVACYYINASDNVAIQNNRLHNSVNGMFCYKSNLQIKANRLIGNQYGLYAYDSDPDLQHGFNDIAGNTYGVRCYKYSEPILGTDSGYGYNDLINTTYNIWAGSDCGDIYALWNYWGGSQPDKLRHDGGRSIFVDKWLDWDSLHPPLGKTIGQPPLSDVEQHNRRGVELMHTGKYGEALAEFQYVITNYSDLHEAILALDNLVQTYDLMGQPPAASPFLDQLAHQYPSKFLGGMAAAHKAELDADNGEVDRAIRAIKSLRRRFAGTNFSKDLLFKLGMIYEVFAKDTSKAVAAFTSFIKQYPNDEMTNFARMELAMLGESEEAPADGGSVMNFGLSESYPNPFNPSTHITFTLPRATHITLEIYNLLGQRVRTLVEGVKEAGPHAVVWDGRDEFGKTLPSGIYLYRLWAGQGKGQGDFVRVRKMVLVR